MTVALICGVGGQDGSYLARLLLDKGYSVWGTSRDVDAGGFANLDRLGIRDRVRLISMTPRDFRSVSRVLSEVEPDEIYALAAQSSVEQSFSTPVETFEGNVIGVLNLLEAIRLGKGRAKLYHASSGECFGDLGGHPADEETPFRPRSPYGVSKAAAHMLVANYRAAYCLFAANGLLFNHESPLRPERFVTRKVTSAVARIALGSPERLRLGRLDIYRDWGWAPEYVEAMWRILQAGAPDDFIVATGRVNRLEDFVAAAFESCGLDWRAHVDCDSALERASELDWSGANPEKIARHLDWRAQSKMADVARLMTAAEMSGAAG